MSPRRGLLLVAVAATIALMAGQAVFAQQPAAQGPQWKPGEYDLYTPITTETQPAKRLDLLNAWKQKFPTSDYENVREQLFLATYTELQRWPEVFAAAKDILDKNPNDLNAFSKVLTALYLVKNPTPDQLAMADKAANQVLSNVDTLFAADKKPAPTVSDADWANVKKSMNLLAQNSVGYAAWQQKDLEKAESGFTKSLQLDPNQGQVSSWLASVVLAQKKPEKYSLMLFEYARAAAYDGPGSLPPAARQQIKTSFDKAYAQIHGSAEGADNVINMAKAAPLPPDGFHIKTKQEILEAKNLEQEAADKANPMLALWRNIKTALSAPDGATYFESSMKGAALPGGANGVTEFKGKLIEVRPAIRPKEVVLAIEDGKTPDVVLKLDAPLAGKMEPGADIGFQGVATAYSVAPFEVTFAVEKTKLTGWKGAAAPPARPVHRPTHRSGD